MSLEPASKTLNRLIIAQAAMNGAHFLAIPVFALHFIETPGIGIETAGFALGLFLASARLGPLFTGPLADRIGVWRALRIGLILRTLGLAAAPMAADPTGAYVAALLLGAGVALHEPAVYGVLGAAQAGGRDRALLRHVQALNFGCVLGPGAALLLGLSAVEAFAAAAASTALVALWAFWERPTPEPRAATPGPKKLFTPDWRYLAFALGLAPFWALFAQLFAALPLLTAEAGGESSWAQSVILLNGLVGFLIVPLILPLLGRLGPKALLAGGCALAATSVGLLAVASGLPAFLALIVALSIAETVVTSGADVLTARHADGRDVASHFGLLTVGAGLGTSIGGSLGVAATDGSPALLVALGAAGLISCFAALGLKASSRSAATDKAF
jgi:MFS family permease